MSCVTITGEVVCLCTSIQNVMPSKSAESLVTAVWVWSGGHAVWAWSGGHAWLDAKRKFTESLGRVSPTQRDQMGVQSRAKEVEVATLSDGARYVPAVRMEGVEEMEEITERGGAGKPRDPGARSSWSSIPSPSSPSPCDEIVWEKV